MPTGSVLDRGADLLHGELTDAYALTHAVLHATDCGLLQPRNDRPASSVADDAEALLGAALACGNLDVAAELLWTWPMLGLPLSPGARYALAELDRAEATHGFLPGPEHDPAVAAALCPADRSTYVIQTSYHTAVAGAVLAAALLRDRGRRPAAPAGRPASAAGRAHRRMPTRSPSSATPTARGPTRCAAVRWPSGWAAPSWWSAPSCAPLPPGATPRGCTRSWPGRPSTGWAHLPSVRQGAALLRAGGPGRGPAGHPRQLSAGQLRSRASAQLEVAVVDPAQPGDRHVVDVALHHPPRPVLPLARQQVRGPLHVPRGEVEQRPLPHLAARRSAASRR